MREDLNKEIEVKEEMDMDNLEEDNLIKIGEILMDKTNGISMMNIPLLQNFIPLDEKKMGMLQECIDLFQRFLIEVLLGEDELRELKYEAKLHEAEKKREKEKEEEE